MATYLEGQCAFSLGVWPVRAPVCACACVCDFRDAENIDKMWIQFIKIWIFFPPTVKSIFSTVPQPSEQKKKNDAAMFYCLTHTHTGRRRGPLRQGQPASENANKLSEVQPRQQMQDAHSLRTL